MDVIAVTLLHPRLFSATFFGVAGNELFQFETLYLPAAKFREPQNKRHLVRPVPTTGLFFAQAPLPNIKRPRLGGLQGFAVVRQLGRVLRTGAERSIRP